ncbi:HAD-IA family hydrolase [Paenibacillus doosanensis]|uniref:HAD family hydrolase n=1 Tax=Paenibacillus doosanensis TaxID=1229154 RepID=UPI0021807F97|nr:HAD-IA family hydrolase [Paenibacillus doosanensis]MCS7460452.1 HAD-IA family hydrolase [Paenibacillus doosanensis]
MYKALFFDFYGTLVHEDDAVIDRICSVIAETAAEEATIRDIRSHWWKRLSSDFLRCYGPDFQTQRELELLSLQDTLERFGSDEDALALSESLYAHWSRPPVFRDTLDFLRDNALPVYILSNIDRADIESAAAYNGLRFDHIITSEDARSYKPHPEMFEAGLAACGLQPDEVLHIGDSATSDIAGASRLGIDAAWINRTNKALTGDAVPKYVIRSLTDLNRII